MPLAIAHFGIGYAIALIGLFVLTDKHLSTIQTGAVIGGVFAMIPDIWRFTPIPKTAIHNTPFADIFFGHRFLDTVAESLVGSELMGVVGVAAMVGVLFTVQLVSAGFFTEFLGFE